MLKANNSRLVKYISKAENLAPFSIQHHLRHKLKYSMSNTGGTQ